jgi:hypothetical protein
MMVHKATFATPLSTLSSGCPFCSSGLTAKAFCFTEGKQGAQRMFDLSKTECRSLSYPSLLAWSLPRRGVPPAVSADSVDTARVRVNHTMVIQRLLQKR